MEYIEALEKIKNALNTEENTKKYWEIIFKDLVGDSDAETITNVQNFVKDNFSFEIQSGAEGYAYYGMSGATSVNADIPIYQCVDEIVKSAPDKYGYISSTQAGMLFNDKWFNDVLHEFILDDGLPLYNGENNSGKLFGNVQSFNDFFSENYIMHLKESNLNMMLSGDYSLNCFGRTEFDAIMKNDAIKTINGIDKNLYKEMYKSIKIVSSENEAMGAVCEAIKASELQNFSDVYFKTTILESGKSVVRVVSKETEGAVSLLDTMLVNGKVSPSVLNDIIENYGANLSDELKTTIQKLSAENESFIVDRCLENGQEMTKLAGKDVVQIGGYEINSSTEDLSLKYADFDTYSNKEKLKLRQYDYERTQITQMLDDGMTSKDGITIFTKDEIKSRYSFIDDATPDSVVRELQIAEGIDRKNGTYTAKELDIYFDEDGKVFAAGNSKYKTTELPDIDAESKFSTTAGDYARFASDDEMMKYDGYAELDELGKIKNKQAKLEYDRLIKDINLENISERSITKYLDAFNDANKSMNPNAVTKTLDNLNAVDKLMIKVGDVVGDTKFSEAVDNFTSKIKGISKTGKVVLPVVDGVCNVLQAYAAVVTVNGYIEQGDYYNATKEFWKGVGTEAAGHLINAALGPYLVAIGTVALGPVGALLGGLAAGLISYGLAECIMELSWYIGEDISGDWKQASSVVPIDPLIVDLDGNGIDMTNKTQGVNFDLNCDGFAEKINWTGSDGILAIDLNENGVIDNGRELFGDYHLLADGSRAANGFEALAQYDTNNDGRIDENDEVFNRLRLWVDADSDGVTDGGELKTLEEMGITAINLNYSNANQTTESGAVLGNVATFEYADDRQGTIGEMWVDADLYDAIETAGTHISEEVSKLPNVRSYGTINSLHAAIMYDESGEIKALAERFMQEPDLQKKMAITEQILGCLCNTGSVEDGSRGGYFSAKKLTVIERFMGQRFNGVNGANPNNQAAVILKDSYKDIVEAYCFSMIESRMPDMVRSLIGADEVDVKNVNWMLHMMLESGMISEEEYITIFQYNCYAANKKGIEAEYIAGTINYAIGNIPDYVSIFKDNIYNAMRDIQSNKYLAGTNDVDILLGSDGASELRSYDGNDLLIGGIESDLLYGGNGNDTLIGGAGADTLDGGYGTDTYVFNIGDGKDTIQNGDGKDWKNDRILFGEGISPEDIRIARNGYDIVISNLKQPEDVITIKNAHVGIDYYGGENYPVGKIEFADGTIWGPDEIKERSRTLYGTGGDDTINGYNEGINYNPSEVIYGGAGNDTIYGNNGDNVLYGEAGDDKLFGGNEDDTLIGGTGADILYGGHGTDTYVFNIGDGRDIIQNADAAGWKNDRILFGEGISPEDIRMTRNGYDIIISNLKHPEDVITIEKAHAGIDYYGGEHYPIGKIEFADGTVWGPDEIKERSRTLYGTGGDDTINGYNEGINYNPSEVIYGGAGNDTIYGNNGDNVLYGEAGDDKLFGGNEDDTLIGGTGADILYGGHGTDTYVFNIGDGRDIIQNADAAGWKNDRILFGEGISPEDIRMTRKGSDIVITNLKHPEDVITIKNAYVGGDYYPIGKIEFADGTVWGLEEIKDRSRALYGTGGNDIINGYNEGINYNTSEIIYAGAGNDTVYGYNGDNVLYGEAGDDKLFGGNEDDTLIGGTGADILYGGHGTDTYVFNIGDGKDIIQNADAAGWKNDRILFGEGISPEDIRMTRKGSDIVITNLKHPEDVITIKNAYVGGDYYPIGKIEFADGTVWGLEEIKDRSRSLYGTGGNDTISGYKDGINYNPSEIIYGGAGNDTLEGGSGNDTYIFNKGDGADIINDYDGKSDRIVFGEGITADSVNIRRSGENLIIRYGEGDSVTVKYAYSYSDGRYLVENIEFADGSVIGVEELAVTANWLYGTGGNDYISGYGQSAGYSENETIYAGAGNDTIYGNDGNDTMYGETGDDKLYGGKGDDTLVGGAGNDTLEGQNGNDTYIFNIGDGADTLCDYDGKSDRIVFGEGITADSVNIQRSGENLVIRYGEGDSVTVKYAYSYSDGRYMVENIEFADGTKWDLSDIQRLVSLQGAGKNVVKGSADAEQYYYDFNNASMNIYDVGGEDSITLGANLLEMIFERSGNDLCITKDTEDSGSGTLTINNWYVGDKYQIENISTADGYSFTNNQVQLLIDDMAAFVNDYGVSEGVKVPEMSGDTLASEQLFASSELK